MDDVIEWVWPGWHAPEPWLAVGVQVAYRRGAEGVQTLLFVPPASDPLPGDPTSAPGDAAQDVCRAVVRSLMGVLQARMDALAHDAYRETLAPYEAVDAIRRQMRRLEDRVDRLDETLARVIRLLRSSGPWD